MSILIATTNPHKRTEIQSLLKPYEITVEALGEACPPDPELEETGDTFKENAALKAIHYSTLYQMPTIADDSGLVIPALDGKPGVHSARFLGEEAGYPEKMNALLSMLSEKETADRNAYFACAIVLAVDGEQRVCIQQNVFGRIADSITGEGGFGYDPIFYLPELNRTFAQIEACHKNRISHRGKAVTALIHLIETHRNIRNLIS